MDELITTEGGELIGGENSSLTLPELLTPKDQETFSLIQRWIEGEESLAKISEDVGISRETLRKRIRSLCYLYSGTEELYLRLRDSVLVNKMIEDEEMMELATDQIAITRARETMRHTEWLNERLIPKRFGRQQQAVDNRIQVVVNR